MSEQTLFYVLIFVGIIQLIMVFAQAKLFEIVAEVKRIRELLEARD